MLGRNTYRQQLTMKVGEIAKLSPDTIKGYQALSGAGQLVGIGRWATGSAKLLGAASPCSLRLTAWPIRQAAHSEWHSCSTLVPL
jgi:hypothetical protein